MQVGQQNFESLRPNLPECFVDICRSDYVESIELKNHSKGAPVCFVVVYNQNSWL